jgi:hypothetical protein
VTSYCIARELRRKFLIKIDNFDMPIICPINEKYDFRRHQCDYKMYTPYNIEQQVFFETPESVDEWENVENVLIWSNQNLFYYFCKNRPEIKYRERLLEGFSLLFTELLHLEPIHVKNLEDCVGIHIRTVDNHMTNPDLKIEQNPYIRGVLVRCKEVIERKDPEVSRIFISSDCDLAYGIAQEVFPDKEIVYNSGDIVHSVSVRDGDGLKKVFRDLLSLAKCKKMYMGWNTNFSKVSALLNPEREFYVYEYLGREEVVRCDLLEIANYFSRPYWR